MISNHKEIVANNSEMNVAGYVDDASGAVSEGFREDAPAEGRVPTLNVRDRLDLEAGGAGNLADGEPAKEASCLQRGRSPRGAHGRVLSHLPPSVPKTVGTN